MQVLILVLSLCAITAGAELLVRGATVIALRMGLSSLFVGLTIVGFGTSSPELGASLFATLEGSNEVSVGNVVGSNVFNIGLILGATALLKPIRVRLAAVRRDLLVAVAASTLPWAAGGLGGELPRWLGAAMVAALAAYLGLAYRSARRTGAEEALAAEELRSTFHVDRAPRRLADRLGFNALLVGLGLALLFVGSRGFVLSAIALAAALGISELVIGLTIVSAGTSLPELVTSIVAARRGNPDIAIGNVIGSNIFNLLGILGVCAVVSPQVVPAQVLWLDLPVMFVATLALLPILRSDGAISRSEGGLLLGGYGVYLGAMFVRGG
ncbi:MAG TPA: calcium/sodium antiporter [Planctomycetota bacterium]|nr:calcium/sodium antiporter [Planctomycetota bacterium]